MQTDNVGAGPDDHVTTSPMSDASANITTEPLSDTTSGASSDALGNSKGQEPNGADIPVATGVDKIMTSSNRGGGRFVPIKSEFILHDYKPVLCEKYIAPADKSVAEAGESIAGEPGAKRQKMTGRNKKRPVQKFAALPPGERICISLTSGEQCPYGESCTFSHDLAPHHASRPADLATTCPVFERFGFCRFGTFCRFGASHIDENGNSIHSKETEAVGPQTRNKLRKETQHLLRKRDFPTPRTDRLLQELGLRDSSKKKVASETLGSLADLERRPLNFAGKLYLAPLTTVGNLPFRRICVQYGADVTCGEMALSTKLLQAHSAEWALLRRHSSEKIFGVQLCGSFPDSMGRAAELVNSECDVDFIDVNCGCPIDLMFKRGEGSGLMDRSTRMVDIVKVMSGVSAAPVTVKMRTGVYEDKPEIAHTLIPGLRQAGCSLVTVHGRTREQRYTRLANWDYMKKCSDAAELAEIPIYGNGDVFDYQEYLARLRDAKVAGCMLARGALIKPWLFTEIKEQRHWDISATERYDMLKQFVGNGLEHWGSDTRGVETTRRFLLEWLSFLYRYVPVGLLEEVPQKLNERPPYYRGRSDLETLMASPACQDWVKLSVMLLGPTPDDFVFLPKHKSNAWA